MPRHRRLVYGTRCICFSCLTHTPTLARRSKALNIHWCCVDIVYLLPADSDKHTLFHIFNVNTIFVSPTSTTETAIVPQIVSAFCRSQRVRSFFFHFIYGVLCFLSPFLLSRAVTNCWINPAGLAHLWCGVAVCVYNPLTPTDTNDVDDDEKAKHIHVCWAYGLLVREVEVSSKYPAEFRCCVQRCPSFIQNV